MKTFNNIRIIGIYHGYGNIKTANTITPTGVIPSSTGVRLEHSPLRWNVLQLRRGSQGVRFRQVERQRLLFAHAHGRGKGTQARRDF